MNADHYRDLSSARTATLPQSNSAACVFSNFRFFSPPSFSLGFPFPLHIFSFFPTPSPRVQVVIRAMAAYQPIPKAREKSEATEEIKGRGVRNAVNVIV